jgi:hypothetical protein
MFSCFLPPPPFFFPPSRTRSSARRRLPHYQIFFFSPFVNLCVYFCFLQATYAPPHVVDFHVIILVRKVDWRVVCMRSNVYQDTCVLIVVWWDVYCSASSKHLIQQ